jgi:hypothetical protein
MAAMAVSAVSGTNDMLAGDVLRRHEMQVWFVAEHLVDTPLINAEQRYTEPVAAPAEVHE